MKELKKIEEAWLGLDISDTEIFNPMSILRPSEDDFPLKLAWLMSRPEYLSFTCSHILNTHINHV